MLYERERLFFEIPMEVSQIISFQGRYRYPLCPQCGFSLTTQNPAVCPFCGQALAWDELQRAQVIML